MISFIKPIFMVVISSLLLVRIGNIELFITQLAEIAILCVLQELLDKVNRKVSYVINGILSFIFCMQIFVYYFSNSYVTTAMLSNIKYLGDLKGKLPLYILGILAIVFVSFIPKKKEERKITISIVLASISIVVLLFCDTPTPLESFIQTGFEYYEAYGKTINIENKDYSEIKSKFYHTDLKDYYSDVNISNKKPNVVVIFTEGLSRNIIDDRPDITPNMNKFINKSISFDNYYNHTFATYRGIQGQLYSGYQRKDDDKNNLISLQSILKDKGYKTFFLNPTPNDKELIAYAKDLGFDEILTINDSNEGDLISDKTMFKLLANEGEKRYNNNEPYLAVLYNIGTHVNVDSPDLKYGDGDNQLLNRFYNYDYYFGEFVNRIMNSKEFDNTIVVLTSDHCTYADLDFVNTFPDYERVSMSLDRIPLAIYYKGIQSKKIDANGRNSLDLIPTILDILDISHENYFLGNSLFGQPTKYSYLYCSENNFFDTSNNTIKPITNPDDLSAIKNEVNDYYLIKNGEGDESLVGRTLDIYSDNKYTYLYIKANKKYDYLNIAIWSESNQSDIKWYQTGQTNKNSGLLVLPNSEIPNNKQLNVHVYGISNEEQELIETRTTIVKKD